MLPPLQQAGFVASETVGGGVGFDLSQLDATGARVLVVDGTAAKVPESALVGPLARAMYAADTPARVRRGVRDG